MMVYLLSQIGTNIYQDNETANSNQRNLWIELKMKFKDGSSPPLKASIHINSPVKIVGISHPVEDFLPFNQGLGRNWFYPHFWSPNYLNWPLASYVRFF